MQTKQNVEIAQTEQKESTNEVAEEVINPVTPEPEEVKIPEPVKKVEESSGEDVDVEDKDSTEPILDKDTLAKAGWQLICCQPPFFLILQRYRHLFD